MKRAILMVRVSSDEQAKGYSLDIRKEVYVTIAIGIVLR